MDEKNKIVFLTLTGPKPPIWLDDLHTDLKRDMQKDGLEGDFEIQASWTRSVQINWPPSPAGELAPKEIIKAAVEKRELLKSKVWGWKRTHYIGQVWSGSDSIGDYTVAFSKDNKLSVKISCRQLKSAFHVSQGSLDIEIKPSMWGDCAGNQLDAMFVNDLNRVVDYRVFDNSLVLELDSGNGAMFFAPVTQ